MKIKDGNRICSVIAAILFIITAIYSLISSVLSSVDFWDGLIYITRDISYITTGMLLLLNKKKLLVIPLFMLIVVSFLFIISDGGLFEYIPYSIMLELHHVTDIISYLVILILSFNIKRGKAFVCFVPILLTVIGYIPHFYNTVYFFSFILSITFICISFLPFAELQTYSRHSNTQLNNKSSNTVGITERIQNYKQLLDEGSLTEKEYEEIKQKLFKDI